MRILAIQTFAGANETVRRHYPYYERAGADLILGIRTTDVGCTWPTQHSVVVGRDSYVSGSHLCVRLIDTIQACLDKGADELMVAEYDTLFFRPMPENFPAGLVMNRTGGGDDKKFRGHAFYHGPWCMTAYTAAQVVSYGRWMIQEGDIEHGWPDRFIGWLAEKYEVPVVEGFFKNYTQNTLDTQQHILEARHAIINGATAVHGCKTAAQLQALIQ